MDEPQNTWSAPAADQTSSPSLSSPLSSAGDTAAVDTVVIPGPAVGRKRSRGLLIGSVVGVVAIIGVVIGVAALGDDAEAYSLPVAATGASEIETISYEMTMDMGSTGTTSATAQHDVVGKKMSMDMSMTMMGQDVEMSAIMDVSTNTMYMGSGFLESFGQSVDADWLVLDLEELSGVDFATMAQQFEGNPLDIAPSLAIAEEVVDLGLTDIDGVEVKHYEVTVDLDEVLKAQPQLGNAVTDEVRDAMPDTIVYDVYVTKDNTLRRMAFELSLPMLPDPVTTTVDIVAINEPLSIEIPAAEDTIDFQELMGG